MPHHATRTRSVWIIALALPPLVLLGACGSGDDTQVASIEGPVSTTESAPAANKIDDGGLAFAACMRENGADFPDPDPDGGFDNLIGSINPSDPKFQDALTACNDLRPAGSPQDRTFDADAQAQILQLTKCMRENGIDLPDPSFDANGKPGDVDLGALNFKDPNFRKAIQGCRKFIDFGAGTP